MQQFFTNEKLDVNRIVNLDNDILYHLKKVLRKTDGWNFRLVDSNNDIYLVSLKDNSALVLEKLNENNELDVDITVIMSLIKTDKFDLTLQKLTELGVKRIVPFEASRSVVKASNEKKLDRYRKIVKEASEQSHRNIIPEITDYCNIKSIDKYLSKNNYLAYEKEDTTINDLKVDESVTIVIGPEGGFDPLEVELLVSKGFRSISLGNRILRAETAAIFATSLVVSKLI